MNTEYKDNNETEQLVDQRSFDSMIHSISLTKFVVFLSFVICIVFMIYKINDPLTLPIKQVRIEGEFRQLSAGTLQKLVQDKVKGGFFNINVTAIRDAVLNEPWVNEVSVHRIWPDGLRVTVKEQVAICRWKNSGLLNEKGELFIPDEIYSAVNLPTLYGPDGTENLLMNRYYQINSLMGKIDMQLDKLLLDDRRALTLILSNDLRVIIGRSDVDERISRFIQYVPYGLREKQAEARQIDMRYTNGFAVQWKEIDSGQSIDQAVNDQGA